MKTHLLLAAFCLLAGAADAQNRLHIKNTIPTSGSVCMPPGTAAASVILHVQNLTTCVVTNVPIGSIPGGYDGFFPYPNDIIIGATVTANPDPPGTCTAGENPSPCGATGYSSWITYWNNAFTCQGDVRFTFPGTLPGDTPQTADLIIN